MGNNCRLVNIFLFLLFRHNVFKRYCHYNKKMNQAMVEEINMLIRNFTDLNAIDFNSNDWLQLPPLAFDGTMHRPVCGIDKIKIFLSPEIIAPDAWKNWYGTRDIYNNRMLYAGRHGNNHHLIINQEFFDFRSNILQQICTAINYAALAGFVNLNMFGPVCVANFLRYAAHITEAEFYFDMRPSEIVVNENRASLSIHEAKEKQGLIRFTDDNHIPTSTFYSYDYNSWIGKDGKPNVVKSTVCFYDKLEKDRAVANQYTFEQLNAHKERYRLEYRLNKTNCAYLNFLNFDGTYNVVFNNYLNFLAVMHNRFIKLHNNLYFKLRKDNKYERIIKQAETINSVYFTNRNARLQQG